MLCIHADDIFLLPCGEEQAICVTTNGVVRKDGRAVMGRGIALYADQRFDLARDLALKLQLNGNRVYDMGIRKDAYTGHRIRVFTYPTKYHWREDSDLGLIKSSAFQLVTLCDQLKINRCYLPCPGCSNGHLNWERQVKPLLTPILDDRFIIADKGF